MIGSLIKQGLTRGSEPLISGSLMQFPVFQYWTSVRDSQNYFFGTQSLHKAFTGSQTVTGAAEEVAFTERPVSDSLREDPYTRLQDSGSG
jgi:hypothetical protein